MRDQLADANKLFRWKIQLHVGRIFLKFVKQLLGRGPKYIMNFGDLIRFIFSWKQGKE